MPVCIQKKLLQYILQPLADILQRIPAKVRTLLFVLSGVGIVAQYFYGNTNYPQPRYLVTFTFGCVMFGIMILMLLPKRLKSMPFDKKLMIPWLIVAISMLFAGISLSYDYLPDAMLFLIGYPVFYIVAGNCNCESVFQKIHLVNDVSYFLFLCVSIFFFPIDGHQYSAFFNNTNGIAFYLVVPFCFSLLGVANNKSSILTLIKDMGILATSSAIMYYTNSRTGQLAAVVAAIMLLAVNVVNERSKFVKTFLTRWVPAIGIVAIMIPGTVFLSQTVQQALITRNSETISMQQDSHASESGTTPQEGQVPSVSQTLQDFQEVQSIKFSSDRTMNSISSGRIVIWKAYLQELGIQGHSIDYDFVIGLGEEYEYLGETTRTAHMTILQMAYNYGLLAGIAYLLFNLIAGIKSIIYAICSQKSMYRYLSLIISCAYGVISILASCISPISYFIAFVYYYVQFPLMNNQTHDASNVAPASRLNT